MLIDSYQELAAHATVTRWLVLAAERFARQRLKALVHAESRLHSAPGVLFVCVRNAGRSQMALGWFGELAGDKAVAWSGGSNPSERLDPATVAAMAELGIDIAPEFPKPWADEFIRAADVVVTMGCGDVWSAPAGKRLRAPE